jgi:signal transduction histidine kinase
MNIGRMHPLAWIVAGLVWLSCVTAHAENIDFGFTTMQAKLSGAIELLENTSTILSPEEALNNPGWKDGTDRMNLSASEAPIWLRLKVSNRTDTAQTRWLTLDLPLLKFVDFYRVHLGDIPSQESMHGGARLNLNTRLQRANVSIFPVTLAHSEEAILLLRVQGQTKLNMEIGLWEPLAFLKQQTSEALWQLLPLSAFLVMAFFVLVHALVRMNSSFLLLAGLVGSMALYGFVSSGYFYRYFFTDSGELPVRAQWIVAQAVVILNSGFIVYYLEMHRLRLWSTLYKVIIAVSLIIALMGILANLDWVIWVSLVSIAVVILIWGTWTLYALWNGVRNAGLCFVTAIAIWTTLALGLMAQLGLLHPAILAHSTLAKNSAIGLGFLLIYSVIRNSLVQQQVLSTIQEAFIDETQQVYARLDTLACARTQAIQESELFAKESARAISDLLSHVTHDLRVPVNEIITDAEMIENSQGDEAAYRSIIRRSATHLQDVLGNMIDFNQSGKDPKPLFPKAIDFLNFLNDLAFEAENLANTNANRFNFRIVGKLPQRINIDAQRLRQVLLCLLDNAAKFTRNGEIFFQVEIQHWPHTSVTKAPNYIFMVRDTGSGMAFQDLQKIFEPFWRTTENTCSSSLGMGLATARHWTKLMDGVITVVSAPGQGTTMRVAISLETVEDFQGQHSFPQDSSIKINQNRRELPVEIILPGSDILDNISNLINMGALSDLSDWANSSTAKNANWSSFADVVANLTENGDLKGLSTLLNRCRKECTEF